MARYVAGIHESKIKKMDDLRSKYPFLEQILANQTYPLFDIEEAAIKDSILTDKCYDHGSEGSEAFDEEYYSVSGHEVKCLGLLFDEQTGQLVDAVSGKSVDLMKWTAPSVRERLSAQRITPNFIVKVRSLEYEVEGEHRHDVSLTIYKVNLS
jgi:hypothetical protein